MDDEQTQDVSPVDTETTEQVVEITADVASQVDPAEVQRLQDLNRQLHARAKKAEEEAKRLKSSVPAPSKDQQYERLELRVDGYTDAETDFIMQAGGKAALSNPFVQAAIKAQRDAAKAKQESVEAVPTSSGGTITSPRLDEQRLKSMSLKELEKVIPR